MSLDAVGERIIIVAPTGRDATMIAKFLDQANLQAVIAQNVDEFCRKWDEGAGAALLAEEALAPEPLAVLLAKVESQPIWSDFPLVLMTTGGKTTRSSTAIAQALGRHGNVTLLERPLRILTMVSAMQAALRARRRQYEARKFLEETEKGLKQRDQFLAMLGHELRNPLVPIRNGIQLLRLRAGDGKTVDQVSEMMDRQVTHMVRIIDDLLDVSRITRGKIILHRERLDLAQVVRFAMDDRRSRLQAAGLKVELEIPKLPVWLSGDPTRLTQVLENLLENAGKFTEKGGRISVHLEVIDQRAVLKVRDTGIGIEPAMLDRMFEIFAQADRSIDRSQGGLGLGLAVVKGLLDLHGGQIQASSDGPGKGAEFTVILPLEAEPPALSKDHFPKPENLDREKQKRSHVLVVEDNRDSAESLRLLLTLFGYHVTLAFSGDDAVLSARNLIPDVVLCDIGLPGMDGFAVAEALRADPKTAQARLIAVTGYGQEEDRRLALEAGFDVHMVKPVDPEKLLDTLNL